MNETYVWYSVATDVTGKKLMEALNCKGGTAKPGAGIKKVICWGTKRKDPVNLGNIKVYNHPDKIKINRNKFAALDKMKKANCNVAEFSTNANKLDFPMIARTNYHQGGAGFWLCLNKTQVNQAEKEGAQYYQKYIDIKDEYRLHIVNGEVIYAVKKTARKNLKDAFVNHYTNYIINYAEKNDINVDADSLEFILRRLARKMATSVDMIIRSNTRGWKFSKIKVENLPANLKTQAVKAVNALGLDYAAVDCCSATGNDAYIIECNTGPGLEGTSFDAWVKALTALIKPAAKKAPMAKKKVVGAAKKIAKDEVKGKLKAQAKMMEAMVDAADDDQLEALEGLWKKMGMA